jgi:hypothetical protein
VTDESEKRGKAGGGYVKGEGRNRVGRCQEKGGKKESEKI